MSKNDSILRACRREKTDRIPAWFMRQAGRYMPEYRAIREKHGFLEMVKTPELAAEVTLQPLKAFDLDAGIIFADILPLLEAMGLELTFAKGEGPRIHNPIRSPRDVENLRDADIEKDLGFTLEAIRIVNRELDASIPLLGFSGAPFTLACYAIEGSGSEDYAVSLAFMREQPAAFNRLLTKISDNITAYLLAQARAGTAAVQLFDSWVGMLSPDEYRKYVQPYTRRITANVRAAGIPLIHFGTRTGPLLEAIAETDPDVISMDADVDLPSTWDRFPSFAVQGNLDPHLLLGPWDEIEKAARHLLDSAGRRPGYIFNLGHGIIKETPPEVVGRLADFVHSYQPS